MVPSWQNPAFVGREEILIQLESLLDGDNQKQPRAAITDSEGLGTSKVQEQMLLVMNAAVSNSA